MKTKQKNDFWDLVDEALESRTIYDTIRILKAKGIGDEEIRAMLQKRHGLNALQCSQALREYVEGQRKKEVKDV